jgi:hypothetical protein
MGESAAALEAIQKHLGWLPWAVVLVLDNQFPHFLVDPEVVELGM